jgi:predicted transcriptional regulator of viral defense system
MQNKYGPDVRGLEAEAYQQGGYFTASQARAYGLSRQLVDHHVRQGRFERIRRGLYRIAGFPADQHDEMRRAWMAVGGGNDALLSHESALALLDLSDNIPDAVHLLVPRRRHGLRTPAGVVLHTHTDKEQIPAVWRDGLPLTTPARTLIDVAGHIQPEQLKMAIAEALRRGLLTTGDLHEQAARRGKTRPLDATIAGGTSQ